MEREKKFQEILELFYRILNKIERIEKSPHKLWGNYKLYRAEALVLEIVALYPSYNITEIASKLGITKGAISQVAKRLKMKGLVEKIKSEGNEKNIFLRLTEKGKKAFETYKNFRNTYFNEIINLFNSLNEEKIEFLELIFRKIDESLTNFFNLK